MSLPLLSEDEEQMIVVRYLEARGLKFTAIPNHTYNPHHSQQRKNKALGLRKGLPDLLVLCGGSLIFLEMKRVKKSVTSPEQREWIEALNAIQNVQAFICKGAGAAIEILEKYYQPEPETGTSF